jgi:hypothetical protein
MKLNIVTLLCLASGAAAFVRQPMQRMSTTTGISMALVADMEDRRAFVTKVSDFRDDDCTVHCSFGWDHVHHLLKVGRMPWNGRLYKDRHVKRAHIFLLNLPSLVKFCGCFRLFCNHDRRSHWNASPCIRSIPNVGARETPLRGHSL